MFIRVNKVRKGSTTYAYTQIVESFRRPEDGKSAHRVVTNLGVLPAPLTENLRRAFQAAARDEVVLLPSDIPSIGKVLASVAYLDVALCLAMLRRLGIDSMLAHLLDTDTRSVPLSSVILALIVHRCVAPGSKLSAQTWYPRTALPELLSLPAAEFNNARIHRAMAALEAVGPELQRRVADRLAATPFDALHLDVTDTWFVGEGPTLAEERLTKEGLWRRKIGIVLLCDGPGNPVRWKAIPGRQSDCNAMMNLASDIQGAPWAKGVPVACDRAMGHARVVRDLARRGIHFVTMLNSNAFEIFAGDEIPFDASGKPDDDDIVLADAAAAASGLTRARERLWVRDLGVRDAGIELVAKRPTPLSHAALLARAREVRARLDAGQTARSIAKDLGSRGTFGPLLTLLDLVPEIQDAMEAGRAKAFTVPELVHLAGLPADAQIRQFSAAQADRRSSAPSTDAPDPDPDDVLPRARVIVVFNPAMLHRKRVAVRRTLHRLDAEIADLNAALAGPHSKRTEAQACAAARQVLGSFKLGDLFEVRSEMRPGPRALYVQVSVHRDEAAWAEQRRRDGFAVLVAHPDLEHSPDQLLELYASKMRIEEDFHVIKSVLDVRPVFHRTDAKIHAHVSLCMLGLLVHRTIETTIGHEATAAATLHLLADVQLVRSRIANGPVLHQLVPASGLQRERLSKLGAVDLLEPRSVATPTA